MTLVGNPIPPLNHTPHPAGAPPGIGVDINFFKRWANSSTITNDLWYPSRPIIDPIGIVIHTNAASVESSLQSSKNWGNRGIYNTKPHYNFNAPRPEKNVPTNRRAIANSSGRSIEQQYGMPDASYWAIAIETCDRGYKASPHSPEGGYDLGPFMYDHDELIARALAYEAIVWDIPLIIPDQFYTPGIYTHTAPWPYPHLTTQRGKTCPTITKKNQILDRKSEIMERARELHAAWTGQPFTPNNPPTQLPDIVFDPINNDYGLWPLNTNKPPLQIGSQGDAVKYLQGALRNKTGAKRPNGRPLIVDGDYGPETHQAVWNLETFFGLPNPNGEVDNKVWDIIDAMVTGNWGTPEPTPPPEPAPTPTPSPEPVAPNPESPGIKQYIGVGTGRYRRQPGEWAWSISNKIYGNPHEIDEIEALNPGQWKPNQVITTPNHPGRVLQVHAGAGALELIRTLRPGENANTLLNTFYFWNGGPNYVLQPGDWVYMPV